MRICLFFLFFAVWFWANSLFTPWATSIDPMLWLYDVLFYTRFVLMFWAVFELLYACWQLTNAPQYKKNALLSIVTIAIAAVLVSGYYYLMHTGNGYRARVIMSSGALAALQKPDYENIRMRAGWFLIDTKRNPCNDQAWLWLGNPFGAGTGNNMALVRSPNAVPKSPMLNAFRFWQVSNGWWLAYQHPQKYSSLINQPTVCQAGLLVDSHQQGMRFISAPVN